MAFFMQPLPRWKWIEVENQWRTQDPLEVKDFRKFFRETGLFSPPSFPQERDGREKDLYCPQGEIEIVFFELWARVKENLWFYLSSSRRNNHSASEDEAFYLFKRKEPFDSSVLGFSDIQEPNSFLSQAFWLKEKGQWQESLEEIKKSLYSDAPFNRLEELLELGHLNYLALGERRMALRYKLLGQLWKNRQASQGDLLQGIKNLF